MSLSNQCASCAHYQYGTTCAAFPAGIPEDIFDGRFDHRMSYPGDNGIRWEKAPGFPSDIDEEADA